MSDSEDRRVEIALFRYTLILPLLRGACPPGGKERLRRQIAAGRYDIPCSSRYAVSPTTLARWERLYHEHGFDGLKPQPRRDQGQSRALSPQTLDRAEALKREQPFRSSRSIISILALDQTNPVPEPHIAPRTLRRQLALRGATAAQLLTQQRPKPYRRFERTHFGDLWQGDAMDGPYLPDPANPDQERQTFLFAFLDDHSRLVPHAQFYWNEQLPRMEDCFKRATLGIQRILGTPYYPEGRGKIERFFQFVQSDFLPELPHSSVTTLPQLNESLLAWIEVVYQRKLHTETGQAPLERVRQDPASSTRPADPLELRQAFLHRDQRKVTKTATFSFRRNRYRVPAYLRGQTVELRYDPFDLTRIEVWFNDTFLQVAEPDRIVITTHPDVEPDPVPVPSPDTGLDYLALLRIERERLLQEQLDTIHFTQLASPNPKEPQDDDHAQ
jgi:transposase InsO family protein